MSTIVAHRLKGFAAALLAALCAACATVEQPCRVAYDMGSSGIRAGIGDPTDYSVKLDSLALFDAQGINGLGTSTITALRELQTQGGFPQACTSIGGGFSVWRFALDRDKAALAATLGEIEVATGVAVLVMPQRNEGRDAYLGARQLLGSTLATTHIVDIGGGSLQIAGEHDTVGAALGQKTWHQELCRLLHKASNADCSLQPMTSAELSVARTHLSTLLKPKLAGLPRDATLTAISRPVTRGVGPAVERLFPAAADSGQFKRIALSTAIDRVAAMSTAEAASRLNTAPTFLQYLLSDMLLVEGILRETGVPSMSMAEAPTANVQGLLRDEHAFAWRRHYACYLANLKQSGIGAYDLDPESCRTP
jgi:hypothetical protein